MKMMTKRRRRKPEVEVAVGGDLKGEVVEVKKVVVVVAAGVMVKLIQQLQVPQNQVRPPFLPSLRLPPGVFESPFCWSWPLVVVLSSAWAPLAPGQVEQATRRDVARPHRTKRGKRRRKFLVPL